MHIPTFHSEPSSSDWPPPRARVAVEGNIASGKSTLLRKLRECPTFQCHICEEPVDQWSSIRDSSGMNILEAFYKDKKQYAFQFQLTALLSRTRLLQRAWHYPWIIYERSIVADRCCFAEMLYEDELITDTEMQIYMQCWEHFSQQTLGVCPTKMIYVKTEPELCHQRISQRARPGEELIPLEYLQRLHGKHEKVFRSENMSLRTLVLDGTRNWRDDDAVFQSVAREISDFIYST